MRIRRVLGFLMRNSGGGAALEFALVAPLLIALCLFAVTAAGAIVDYRRVMVAAEAGADAGAASLAHEADIEAVAALAFGERGSEGLSVDVTCEAGGGSSGMVVVEVSYTAPETFMLGGAMTMSARGVRAARSGSHCGARS